MNFLDHLKAGFRGGLDGILADINKTIAKLEAHAGYEAGLAQAAYNNADYHRKLEQENLLASSTHSAASDKALAIKARIAALVA